MRSQDNFTCTRENCFYLPKPQFREPYFIQSPIELDSFAIQKGGAIITRTFALLPDTDNHLEQQPIYHNITELLVKARALKNKYVKLMIQDALTNGISRYKETSMSKCRQAIYDTLHFSQETSPEHSSYELKERAKQCAFYDAFLVVREWLIRKSNLSRIISALITKLSQDQPFAIRFLKGERLYSSEVPDIKSLLTQDCFGKNQSISTHFMNNYIYQIRNLFFQQTDFYGHGLYSPQNSLQAYLSKKVSSLKPPKKFIQEIANGFKKGKQQIKVPEDTLEQYLFDLFFNRIKHTTTRLAHRIIASHHRIVKLRSKRTTPKRRVLIQKTQKRIDSLKRILFSYLRPFEFESFEEFKRERKYQIDKRKVHLSKHLGRASVEDLYFFIEGCFMNERDELVNSPNQYVLKRIFKPHFPSIKLKYTNDGEIQWLDFVGYMEYKVRYALRERLKELFFSTPLLSSFITGLESIRANLDNLLKFPEHKALSLSIMNRDVYDDGYRPNRDPSEVIPAFPTLKQTSFRHKKNYSYYEIDLNLVSKKAPRTAKSYSHNFILRVRDGIILRGKIYQNRIEELKQKGFEPMLPVINLKHRKLLLNLPFQHIKKGSLKPFEIGPKSNLVMGLDLGLKHFAVTSIWDTVRNKEVARYFLGPREVFDKKFNSFNGKIYEQEKMFNPHSSKKNNIKRDMVHLRQQIIELQRKKNNYEQRCLQRGITVFRKKLKWNKIRKQLSLCWDRLNCLNTQIVNYLNHWLIEIAKYWNVNEVKVEDLRWASHQKKRDAGMFLAFWQTHWFYSQVQDAFSLQCQMNTIGFRKVSARNTSQNCSKCGQKGSRLGKGFACDNHLVPYRLDSDLNAARNIAQA